MEKLTYVIDFNGKDPRALLLAKSIRKHGGALSEHPIWILVPDSDVIPENMEKQISSLNARIIRYPIDPDVKKFPLASMAVAAATAESLAKGKSELLAWLTLDTLIIKEPSNFLLEEGKNLGYRPVHHTLVGSFYDKPLDPFWELVYTKCSVPEDRVFPMKTHVDGNVLRPYFNAGFMIVRPEKGLLQSWWRNFEKYYRDPGFMDFYSKNDLYAIFIHQAILSGTILSKLEKQELKELPFSYNYPLHLFSESPAEFQPENINDLVMVRYENPKWLKEFTFLDPFQAWLTGELSVFSTGVTK